MREADSRSDSDKPPSAVQGSGWPWAHVSRARAARRRELRAAAAMAAAPPPMTPEKAKLILKETITLFSQPENQKRLTDALAEVAQLPPEQQPMGKMAKLMPIVTELAGGKLQEYGLPNVMMGVMQIQAVGQQDPVVMEGVQLLTAATMGNVPDAATLQAFVAKCG